MGDLDVVTEDLVEADLEGGDPAFLAQLVLIVRQPLRAVSLETSALVKFGVESIEEEAALTKMGGRIVDAAFPDATSHGDQCGRDGLE